MSIYKLVPPCVPRSGRPKSALFRDSGGGNPVVYLAMRGITVGSHVSQEAGRQIALDAQDDGASDPPGTGGNKRRRERRRVRIYGNVIESAAANRWTTHVPSASATAATASPPQRAGVTRAMCSALSFPMSETLSAAVPWRAATR